MAQVWEYIKIALMNIRSNKGRSVLTMLGIIIGISSVIMIISIGNGVKGQINGELNDMAGGQIYVMANTKNNKDAEPVYFNSDDFQAIREKVDHVKGVSPCYTIGGSVEGRKGNFDAYIAGGTQDWEFNVNQKIIKGKYFTEADYYASNCNCVLTEKDARTLFGTTDVIGMTLDITMYNVTQEFTVVGIRENSASSMLSAMEGDSTRVNVEIPLSVLGSKYGFYVEDFDGFYVMADSGEYSTQVANDCIRLLEGRHNVRGQSAITVENFNDYLGQINSVLGTLTIFVVFVAAISLLVGGIGVMNIMLVSVTERTREIGIRKSLGARTKSILLQFLSESAIITLLGGIIGIILGVVGAAIVCMVLGFTAKVTVGTVLGASLFSSAVGIFFGIYPARKAAKLSPIEALRHE